MDAVPADLNTEQDPRDWNRPFPRLTRTHDIYNFKSPTIHQAQTWKKGLEVVLQPNYTLVMKALTRSQKEVVPLQNSTLVMFELKTSTGSEKTLKQHQELETQSSERNCAGIQDLQQPAEFPMFSEPEHPALQMGNPVTPALHETGMSSERQDIVTSSQGSSGVTPSTAAAVR